MRAMKWKAPQFIEFAAQQRLDAVLINNLPLFESLEESYLRGLKDTLVPMWIASVGYWVLGLLGGWILCFPLGYGAVGLWWGLAAGLIATGSALVWRLMLRTRVTNL